jgi:PAS domain S-box-containing protein
MTFPAAVKARHPRLQERLSQATGPDGTVRMNVLIDGLEADYAAAELTRSLSDHLTMRVADAEGHVPDVTGLQHQARLTQARMDLVLEYASEAVVSCDATGAIVAFNHAAARMYGWAAAEVLGQHFGMLFDGRWSPAREAIWQKMVAGRQDFSPSNVAELRGVRRDGERFDLEITLSRVEVDGEVTLTGFHRDVSAAKAEQARLTAAASTAEAANQAKTEFLAAMSHEIRTPLNGVLGMAAALETTPLSDLQRRMLGVINDSGQSLMTLLSDILDLSKIEAGRWSWSRRRSTSRRLSRRLAASMRRPRGPRTCGSAWRPRTARAASSWRPHTAPAGAAEPDQQRDEVHRVRLRGGARLRRIHRGRRAGYSVRGLGQRSGHR